MTESEWLMCEDPQRMLTWLMSEGIKRVPPQTTSTGRLCSDRKLRLFAVACCREVWHLLTDSRSRRAVDVAERYADGLATERQLENAVEASWLVAGDNLESAAVLAAHGCTYGHIADVIQRVPGACVAAHAGAVQQMARRIQASILRDIIGNPFRPIYWADDPKRHAEPYTGPSRRPNPQDVPHVEMRRSWLTPTVLTLAEAAYEERETVWECRRHGRIPASEVYEAEEGGHGHAHPTGDCWQRATRLGTGHLDPVRLAVLADALEEAGCSDEVEYVEAPAVMCCPKCGETGDHVRGNQVAYLMRCNSTECRFEWVLGETCRVKVVVGPNPILAHLRNPSPHYRGCWAIDLLTGKE